MPIWFFPALLAFFAIVAIAAGIWLLLHAQAVATLFRRHGDVVPAPRKPRASKGAVLLALTRDGQARLRYAFSCGALTLMLITAVATAATMMPDACSSPTIMPDA